MLAEGTAIAGFLAAGFVVHRKFRSSLPRLAALFAITMVLNAMGWVFEFYSEVPGFDEITHGLTTTAITGLLGWLAFKRLLRRGDYSWEFTLAVFSLGVMLGVLWEAVEWFSYLITGRPGIIKSLNDTVSDLLWDVMGAALALPLLKMDGVRTVAYPWRFAAGTSALIAAVWSVAENRGDDALVVDGEQAIIDTHRYGEEGKELERLTDEDLYDAARKKPDEYVGRKLIFKRTISAIDSSTKIMIDADGMIGSHELAVQLPEGALPAKAAVGDQVEILGTIRLAGGEPRVEAEAILDHAGDE